MIFVSVCAGKRAKSGKNPKKHPFPAKFREKEKGVYSRPDTSEKKAEAGIKHKKAVYRWIKELQ